MFPAGWPNEPNKPSWIQYPAAESSTPQPHLHFCSCFPTSFKLYDWSMFCTGVCFNIKIFSLVSLPWHVLSLVSSLYPFLQLHSKLPTVFLHTWSHPPLFMRHSSMSVPRERESLSTCTGLVLFPSAHLIQTSSRGYMWNNQTVKGVTGPKYDRFVWA